MKLTDYQGKRIRVTAPHHPMHGLTAFVATVNRRTRKLSILTKTQNGSALTNKVEVLPEEKPAKL